MQEGIAVTVLLRHRFSRSGLPSLEDLSRLGLRERRYLTHKEFEKFHGADPEDIETVKAFAAENNLGVVAVDTARRTVELAGTLGAFGAAFGTEFAHYDHQSGVCRGPTGPISVPAGLAPVVEAVFGLDDRSVGTRHAQFAQAAKDAPSSPGSLTSYPVPEIAKLYNFPKYLSGAGQCIGVIELYGGFKTSDLEAYFETLGLPMPQITVVGSNAPGDQVAADMEVTMDIEIVGAVAPGAHIVAYIGSAGTYKTWYGLLSTAIHDAENKPSVLTISWSEPETLGLTDKERESLNTLFKEAALLGITICVSSGDYGSCASSDNTRSIPQFPTSSPLVLGCGGTTLKAADGVIEEETVWNTMAHTIAWGSDASAAMTCGGASGGGVSTCFALPSYQGGAGVPEAVTLSYTKGVMQVLQRFAGRGVPDVAADGDLMTGYQTLFDGHPIVGGGTSASAPLWAGLIARLNQGLGHRVGFLNPLLYRLVIREKAEIIRAITLGNNCGYEAAPGKRWNACTGLGCPDGTRLLSALSNLL